jgi:hypothetical protein
MPSTSCFAAPLWSRGYVNKLVGAQACARPVRADAYFGDAVLKPRRAPVFCRSAR